MSSKPTYDFKSDFFKKNPFYKRLAKDHLSLFEIDSDVIKWEVVNTRGAMKIPCEYHFHFYIKSIVGTKADKSPVYGKHHIAKVTFPPKYPIEPPELYMQTDLWHPNIKSEGKYKGRICGNTKGFGLGYDLYLLVIRIGEILQFKQYHAENTPPFPEDIKAARWVMEYAEPNGIVNKYQDLAVDETPLINIDTSKDRKPAKDDAAADELPKEEPKKQEPRVVETNISETPVRTKPKESETTSVPGKMKINIVAKKAAGKKKIVIQKKNK
ncbi:ubiquitin-conjugating enzyme E2 [Portibacter marinus]|uniref:ubiquitin-conjugating enzyme E2 n=1 Tax=Portibacter marinus TaxID=2898660 RepID=UPI001F1DEA84|nr:ubiquitin-conjugating enzyme E2 [Portibacter marinus]